MEVSADPRYREGLARLLLGICLLLFAIASGVLSLATAIVSSSGVSLFGYGLYLVTFVFAIIGLAVGMEGYNRMSTRQG